MALLAIFFFVYGCQALIYISLSVAISKLRCMDSTPLEIFSESNKINRRSRKNVSADKKYALSILPLLRIYTSSFGIRRYKLQGTFLVMSVDDSRVASRLSIRHCQPMRCHEPQDETKDCQSEK